MGFKNKKNTANDLENAPKNRNSPFTAFFFKPEGNSVRSLQKIKMT